MTNKTKVWVIVCKDGKRRHPKGGLDDEPLCIKKANSKLLKACLDNLFPECSPHQNFSCFVLLKPKLR